MDSSFPMSYSGFVASMRDLNRRIDHLTQQLGDLRRTHNRVCAYGVSSGSQYVLSQIQITLNQLRMVNTSRRRLWERWVTQDVPVQLDVGDCDVQYFESDSECF